MKQRLVLLAVLLLGVLVPGLAWSENGKLSGYYIGDYYNLLQSHNPDLEGRHGFQYRRIYFQYDKGLAGDFSMRLRFEMNSKSFPDDKFKLEPFVKHAYLQWNHKDWRLNALLGQSGTPTWGLVEKVWGYRSVAKTLLDMQKMGGSTDFGIALQGVVDEDKKLLYYLMVANGGGTSAETNNDKRIYLAVTGKPADGISAQAYGDYDKDKTTLQGFLAYQQDTFRVGVQAVHQILNEEPEDVTIQGFSLFGAAQVVEKKLWALGRVDRLTDASPGGEKMAYTQLSGDATPTELILGLDWVPENDWHVISNVFVALYDKPAGAATSPDTVPQPRRTIYLRFS